MYVMQSLWIQDSSGDNILDTPGVKSQMNKNEFNKNNEIKWKRIYLLMYVLDRPYFVSQKQSRVNNAILYGFVCLRHTKKNSNGIVSSIENSPNCWGLLIIQPWRKGRLARLVVHVVLFLVTQRFYCSKKNVIPFLSVHNNTCSKAEVSWYWWFNESSECAMSDDSTLKYFIIRRKTCSYSGMWV